MYIWKIYKGGQPVKVPTSYAKLLERLQEGVQRIDSLEERIQYLETI